MKAAQDHIIFRDRIPPNNCREATLGEVSLHLYTLLPVGVQEAPGLSVGNGMLDLTDLLVWFSRASIKQQNSWGERICDT